MNEINQCHHYSCGRLLNTTPKPSTQSARQYLVSLHLGFLICGVGGHAQALQASTEVKSHPLHVPGMEL